jgi:hypothetical protein
MARSQTASSGTGADGSTDRARGVSSLTIR